MKGLNNKESVCFIIGYVIGFTVCAIMYLSLT